MGQQFERQLKKGVLEMLVLKMLSRERMYGYQLIQSLKAEGEGFFSLQQGTLYPILYRLEDGGSVVSSWEEPVSGKTPKKYYVITESGRQELAQQMALWEDFTRSVSEILKKGEEDHG